MTEQEEQAYNALYKWSDRLNKWEYNKQYIRNKKRKLKQFNPNAVSLLLIDKMNELTRGKITAEEAMSVLNMVEVRTETRLCMEAGF